MPVFAVDDDGREGGKHHSAAECRAQQATRRPEKQHGRSEFQRSGHEMKPARVSPFQVFLVDGSRGEDVAERTHDEESGKGQEAEKVSGTIWKRPRVAPELFLIP